MTITEQLDDIEDVESVLEKLSEAEKDEFLSLSNELVIEETRQRSRKSHLDFMKYCWRKPKEDPFIVGFHTREICARIDKAIEDFRNGKSSFIRIAVHNRSGKSDIVSRFLSPHFIGEFPWKHVIQASFNAEKGIGFGKEGRTIVMSEKFKELYPLVSLSRRSMSAREWMLSEDGKDTDGRVFSSGLHSGLTGAGGHLLILDDYVSGRADAESAVGRENVWDAFKDDFMTRRAPVCIVVVLATQWHWDDLHGRIERKNDPKSEEYEPDFPNFELLKFPARRKDSDTPEKYPGEYLFLERYSETWYREMYATLGRYSSAAIMDCNPVRRGGNILDVSRVIVHPSDQDCPTGLKWLRVWDYAHSAKQRIGDNPDFTGGTRIAFRKKEYAPELKQWIWEIWVKDYEQFREKAPERDKKIREITKRDGPKVKVLVENSLDSMDGAEYLKQQLMGLRTVIAVNCPGDKVTRCSPVEPIFEAGNVHIIKGVWNDVWLEGLERFDGSGNSHDEMVDNLTCGYQFACVSSGYKKLKSPW